jgi:hypothetical protein
MIARQGRCGDEGGCESADREKNKLERTDSGRVGRYDAGGDGPMHDPERTILDVFDVMVEKALAQTKA